jgi:hypothetical protein
MLRIWVHLAPLLFLPGCALFEYVPPSPHATEATKAAIDEVAIAAPIREAIPIGSSKRDAERWLEGQGFKAPPFGSNGASRCWGPYPYVRNQRYGHTTIRTEVFLNEGERVETLKIRCGYAWNMPEDAG